MDGFTVRIFDLLDASASFTDIQNWANTIHRALINSCSDAAGMAGDDAAGSEFAARYDKAADAVVNGWGRAVGQLGGTANGLYATAITYIAADQDIAEQLHGPYQLPAASNPQCEEETNVVQLPSARGHSNWAVRDIIGHFWPQGDPGKLRRAAEDWTTAAQRFETASDAGEDQTVKVVASNFSSAIDAFSANWARTRQCLTELATAARQLASACSLYAAEIDKLRAHLEHLAEIAGGVATGAGVLTFFTVGISDAAGAVTEGVIATEAAAAAAATTAELSASSEIAVLAEAAEIVDAAAARMISVDTAVARVGSGGTGGVSTAQLEAYYAAGPPAPPGVLGPVPPPADSRWPDLSPARQREFRAWMAQMQAEGRSTLITMPPASSARVNARRFYQMRIAGDREYTLYTTVPGKTGGEMGMDADGLRPQDGAAIETKYVGQQQSCDSPLRIGNTDGVPSYVYDSTSKQVNSEIQRYGSAMTDPRNHHLITHLEIDTNDGKAAAYMEAMRLAYGVPGHTRVIQ